MTTGSGVRSGSLLSAIWLLLSVVSIDLAQTLTVPTDKFSGRESRAVPAPGATRRDGRRALSV